MQLQVLNIHWLPLPFGSLSEEWNQIWPKWNCSNINEDKHRWHHLTIIIPIRKLWKRLKIKKKRFWSEWQNINHRDGLGQGKLTKFDWGLIVDYSNNLSDLPNRPFWIDARSMDRLVHNQMEKKFNWIQLVTHNFRAALLHYEHVNVATMKRELLDLHKWNKCWHNLAHVNSCISRLSTLYWHKFAKVTIAWSGAVLSNRAIWHLAVKIGHIIGLQCLPLQMKRREEICSIWHPQNEAHWATIEMGESINLHASEISVSKANNVLWKWRGEAIKYIMV